MQPKFTIPRPNSPIPMLSFIPWVTFVADTANVSTRVPVDEQQDPAPPTAAKRTVLVVDDDPAIRDVVVDMLSLFDLDVMTAAGGREGIAVYETHHATIDVVLLDIRMPDLDGISTYGFLRQINPEVPIIFSSGYTETDDVLGLIKPPSTVFLPKPYDLSALVSTVQTVSGEPLM